MAEVGSAENSQPRWAWARPRFLLSDALLVLWLAQTPYPSGDRSVKFSVDAYPSELFQGKVHQIRMNSTTTQNVVTYPVIIEANNRDLKLMPGMTANITFLIEARENVLRVPAAALRYVPPIALAHPDDRHYVEGVAGPADSGNHRQEPAAGQVAQLQDVADLGGNPRARHGCETKQEPSL